MTEKGVAFESVNYMEKPLSANELTHLLRTAGLRPHDVMRTKEAAYQELVKDRDLSDKELIRVMVEHPELIQRPIVSRGDKAVLARSLDKLAELGLP